MSAPLARRTVLAGLGAVGVLGTLGCSPAVDRAPLALATGGPQGVYSRLGGALAAAWRDELAAPAVAVGSEGSVDNVAMIVAGRAQVGFCAADVAVDAVTAGAPLRALARVHDDAIQLVVPADSPVRRLADLAGRRVSIGAPSSGVLVIAPRLLDTVGLVPDRDLVSVRLGLAGSALALERGEIDAFFWSGGVPTTGVDLLAAARPVRLVDLDAETRALRARFPVYDATTVPARTYGLPDPVTTTSVRNVLLVAAAMPDDRAAGLTRVLVERRAALAAADSAGRSIDPRAAIGTQPVPLHPGAVTAYRALKGD